MGNSLSFCFSMGVKSIAGGEEFLKVEKRLSSLVRSHRKTFYQEEAAGGPSHVYLIGLFDIRV